MPNAKITIGFSPCPNDTFIFDAMVNNKIDTEGLDFEVDMVDVEELNRMAFKGELDITKLSYHAYAHLSDDYILLNSGSALGNNCGPLLIANSALQMTTNDKLQNLQIAIPGRYTTANFLLSLAYPDATNKVEMLFSEVEEAVLSGKVDAGVIIHENRFTYEEKGLKKITDLGEYWEKLTGLPIPLGGIAVKRTLKKKLQQKVDSLLKKSISFAMENNMSSSAYVIQHAQEIDQQVLKQHIELYVNDYTLGLGKTGRSAILKMFNLAEQKGIIPEINKDIFLEK